MKKFIALVAFVSVLASCGVAGLSSFESVSEPVSYIDYRPFLDDDFYFIPNGPWTRGFTPIAELKVVLTPSTYRHEGFSEGRPPFEALDYEGFLRIVEEKARELGADAIVDFKSSLKKDVTGRPIRFTASGFCILRD